MSKLRRPRIQIPDLQSALTGGLYGDFFGVGEWEKPLVKDCLVYSREYHLCLLECGYGEDEEVLQAKGIHIWHGNASRDYLDSIGLTGRQEGDLGPVYGFQWRHFGAEYTDMHSDYTGIGFDQLLDVIHKIKNNPDDRRIILSAWNPSDLKEMALPPCHMFSQNDGGRPTD